MGARSRGARLPFDHLLAELAAFPLASEAALANPVTHLEPDLGRTTRMGEATARLWREAERDLLAAAPGVTLTELVAMRDECWFGTARPDRAAPGEVACRSSRSLQSFLCRLTRSHLEVDGPGYVPRLPVPLDGPHATRPTYSQARRSWMWLTFALPEDLLLACPARDSGTAPVDLLTPAVRRLLSRGFAETHLHAGAALDFRTVWSLLLARLSWPGLGEDELQAPGAALRDGRDLPAWLLRCAIARVVLAALAGAADPDLTLNGYLQGPFLRRVVRSHGVTTVATIGDALGDLIRGRLSPIEQPLLQDAYGALAGTHEIARVTDPGRAELYDPVSGLLTGAGTPDQRLLWRTCAYLQDRERRGSADTEAATLLWQTVRVRTILYRHITQRPLTPGLPWFIRFYERLSRTRGPVNAGLLMASAARRCGGDLGLASLEARTSPGEDLRDWLSAAAGASAATSVPAASGPAASGPAAARRPEVGLVLHFLKSRSLEYSDGAVRPGVPPVASAGTTADPGTDAYGYRYGMFYRQQRARAVTLARLLHTWPRTLHLVRGLDLCADELAVPSWVFKPLLTYLRRTAGAAARQLDDPDRLRRAGRANDVNLPQGPGTSDPGPPPPLRTTVHAGEDYSHLLTGLRSVWEAVEVLGLREGDRIGHGLALGIDPGRWCGDVGQVAMPLEDRVLDLAWEWSWWTRRGQGGDTTRLAYLARQIAHLGTEWFGRETEPRHLEQLAQDLTDGDRLRAAGFPDDVVPAAGPDRPARLHTYLTDSGMFRRGRQGIKVDPGGEVDALQRLSESLRSEIGRRGIAIEINPTSNLLIGDLSDLENHPLWRMVPPLPCDTTPPLAVTIGSDDPVIFNTSLPEEYQRLYDALVLAGLSDAQALTWLDGVRLSGLQRRFTTPSAPSLSRDDLWALDNPGTLDLPFP